MYYKPPFETPIQALLFLFLRNRCLITLGSYLYCHSRQNSILILSEGQFHKKDWMKRLAATGGSILLRTFCGINREAKESQLWTSSVSIWVKSPVRSASSPKTVN